jgi:OmcA/MtrC family decaheme c-type cytochrome
MNPLRKIGFARILTLLGVLTGALALQSAGKKAFTVHDKAYYASATAIDFVRPGLVLTVTGASIASDGTIQATFTIADPQGLPLDMAGVTTPGAVSVSLMIATIPKGQTQYTAYTTRVSSNIAGTVSATQATSDSGGTFAQTAAGQYTYTFKTKAPTGWDASATHTIGAWSSRNLTSFSLGTNYASSTYNFVPNGSKVATVRDIIRTPSCNSCHDQLAFHGGSRRGVELCVMCHTPQTTDPNSGNTLNFPVMVHKIHMGALLPSVKAGKPYQIIGFQNSVNDFSKVVYPADPGGLASGSGVIRCTTCHSQTTGATQATAYMTTPSSTACGACHDDVNFATGVNHAGGPQVDDTQCANCHIPQGELEFDASIMGAHTVPTESKQLAGLNLTIVNVANGTAGSKPTVTFTAKDNSGNAIPLSTFHASTTGWRLALVMAGPTSDYGYTSFGSDLNTPGYDSEDPTSTGTCGSDGTCTYTFTHAIPAGAIGTFAMGIEGRAGGTLNAGDTNQMSVEYGATNKVVYFSVDGSAVTPRRTVVDLAHCDSCHVKLSLHGENRNQIEMCVLCHNPSDTDGALRATTTDATQKAKPAQGINFALLVHKVHTGPTQAANGRPYVVVGFGGSINDFSNVLFPAFSLSGSAQDTQNCALCHTNDSNANFPIGLNKVTDPQGLINPVQPTTSACTACHSDTSAVSHALANTTTLGESCATCHATGAAFDVDQVHAQ